MHSSWKVDKVSSAKKNNLASNFNSTAHHMQKYILHKFTYSYYDVWDISFLGKYLKKTKKHLEIIICEISTRIIDKIFKM